MPYSDIYLYSPLSTESVKQGEGKALLLQFILSELFRLADSNKKDDPLEFVFSTPACFFPFDWSYEVGCLNKIDEHAKLLSHAFKTMEESLKDFRVTLEIILDQVLDRKKHRDKLPHQELIGELAKLYSKIIPFLIACKESENLVLFLLRHKEEIEALSSTAHLKQLLEEMFPQQNFEMVRSRYDQRGFKGLRKDFDALVSPYERQ